MVVLPPIPEMVGVAEDDLGPSAAAGWCGSCLSGLGEIQSAGLLNRVWLVPRFESRYWNVMPTGCCLGRLFSSS